MNEILAKKDMEEVVILYFSQELLEAWLDELMNIVIEHDYQTSDYEQMMLDKIGRLLSYKREKEIA